MATPLKSPAKRKSSKGKNSVAGSHGVAQSSSKKRKLNAPPPSPPQQTEDDESSLMATTEIVERIPIFKDPNFVHSTKSVSGVKRRGWKNLKQIIASERSLAWGPDAVTYSSMEGPPSFKPTKKYSDISGLESKYRDPQSKLYYHDSKEFAQVRMLPGDSVSSYLALRKANAPVP